MDANEPSILQILEYIKPYAEATHANAIILAQVKAELTTLTEQQQRIVIALYGEPGESGLVQALGETRRALSIADANIESRKTFKNNLMVALISVSIPIVLGALMWAGMLMYDGFLYRNKNPTPISTPTSTDK
jgi:hypothetical protein